MMSKLAKSENSILYLVSVAEKTDLSLVLSETPKIGFLMSRPMNNNTSIYDFRLRLM